MNEAKMVDNLRRMWGSFSLSEVEGIEMEIQNYVWEEGANQGENLLGGEADCRSSGE
jgi:hypothetical protein